MADEQSENDDGPEELVTSLQLRLHALNLPRSGVLKSPPSSYVVVEWVEDRFSKTTSEWGRTEVVSKNCHPQWTTPLPLLYEYGTEQHFFARVLKEKDNVLLGSALFEVGDVLGTRNNTKVKRLQQGGCIFAHLEPSVGEGEPTLFRFQLRAMELLNVSSMSGNFWSSGPDTILEFAKQQVSTIGNSWMAIYRSSPVFDSFQPTWDESEIDLGKCCGGDLHCPIRVTVWCRRKGRSNALIGVCETTIHHMLNSCLDDETVEESEMDLFLVKPKALQKEVGRLRVIKAQLIHPGSDQRTNEMDNVQQSSALMPPPLESPGTPASSSHRPTLPKFQDYLDSGLEIDLCVAIDFTSSNGDPRNAGTLHYQSAKSLNDYEEAIIAIGESISVYSKSRDYAVWGFGAKFGGAVRHIFQCGPSHVVHDVEGILEAYRSVFKSELIMSGPTSFEKVIQAAALRAKTFDQQMETRLQYCVLLILTDGIADNLEETKRKLEVYRDLPLTVVIIGIGRAEFRSMNTLCDNDRRNVIFVEFRHHQHDPASITKAALKGLPRQILNYMRRNGIFPLETNGING